MLINEIITEAVADIEQHGFDSQYRVNKWINRILAETSLRSQKEVLEYLGRSLGAKYKSLILNKQILRQHKIPLFTLEMVKPKCRAELDRRIMASAQLIKLNRDAAIQKTLQRFSGWATSIPAGGSDVVDKIQVKKEITKSIKSLNFIDRRVAIDQGHKLVANVNDIVAVEAGAIAAIWHSHWRQAGYDYRPDHKERDSKIFVIRDNWAMQKGFVKLGGHQYTDEITKPAEEVFCQCYYQYLYHVKDLPDDMKTVKYWDTINANKPA